MNEIVDWWCILPGILLVRKVQPVPSRVSMPCQRSEVRWSTLLFDCRIRGSCRTWSHWVRSAPAVIFPTWWPARRNESIVWRTRALWSWREPEMKSAPTGMCRTKRCCSDPGLRDWSWHRTGPECPAGWPQRTGIRLGGRESYKNTLNGTRWMKRSWNHPPSPLAGLTVASTEKLKSSFSGRRTLWGILMSWPCRRAKAGNPSVPGVKLIVVSSRRGISMAFSRSWLTRSESENPKQIAIKC